jgi:hypothetical protein
LDAHGDGNRQPSYPPFFQRLFLLFFIALFYESLKSPSTKMIDFQKEKEYKSGKILIVPPLQLLNQPADRFRLC